MQNPDFPYLNSAGLLAACHRPTLHTSTSIPSSSSVYTNVGCMYVGIYVYMYVSEGMHRYPYVSIYVYMLTLWHMGWAGNLPCKTLHYSECFVYRLREAIDTEAYGSLVVFHGDWLLSLQSLLLFLFSLLSCARDSIVKEFWKLGLGQPFACSAVEGVGISDLLDR